MARRYALAADLQIADQFRTTVFHINALKALVMLARCRGAYVNVSLGLVQGLNTGTFAREYCVISRETAVNP